MNRQDLDLLVTKQDFFRPNQLSSDQEYLLSIGTQVERLAFASFPSITIDSLKDLEQIHSSSVIYIARTVEHPYISKGLKEILFEIATRLQKIVPDSIMIIVSMTRTVDESEKANKQISSTSTHTKGEAFDIPGKFMRKYFSNSTRALLTILEEMQKENKIYFTNEEEITSFWHIARKL